MILVIVLIIVGQSLLVAVSPVIMATPTKPAQPPSARASLAPRSPGGCRNERCCISCKVSVATTRYYTLDVVNKRRKATRENLAELFSSYLGVEDVVKTAFDKGLSYGSGHIYACEGCTKSAETWSKVEQKRHERRVTFMSHAVVEASTQPTTPSNRQKRQATETPDKTVKRSAASRLNFGETPQSDPSVSLSPAMARLAMRDEPEQSSRSQSSSQSVSKVEVCNSLFRIFLIIRIKMYVYCMSLIESCLLTH